MSKSITNGFFVFVQLCAVLLVLSGCQSTYYKTMELFGYHKRELLVERVEDARDAQQDAKEQFRLLIESEHV